MKYNITLLPGDGIGPQLISSIKPLFEKISSIYNIEFSFTEGLIGGAAYDAVSSFLPDETIEHVKDSDATIIGPIGGLKWQLQGLNPEIALLRLKKEFNLYSDVKIFRPFNKVMINSPIKAQPEAQITLVTDALSGIYKGESSYENTESGRGAYDKETYSELEIEKIARTAYEIAENSNHKLALVDKADALLTSRLWRKIVTDINEDYPNVQVEMLYLNQLISRLIFNPNGFDVILSSNMFGDTIRDALNAITKYNSCIPQALLGENTLGIYRATQIPNEELVGTPIINPVGIILSIASMFKYSLDQMEIGQHIEYALSTTIEEGYIPFELGGNKMLHEIIARLLSNM